MLCVMANIDGQAHKLEIHSADILHDIYNDHTTLDIHHLINSQPSNARQLVNKLNEVAVEGVITINLDIIVAFQKAAL